MGAEPGPADPTPRRQQFAEAPERLCEVWEHQAHDPTCACRHVIWGRIPPAVLASTFGPRLAAIAGFLSRSCHLSKRQVEEAMQDVLQVPQGIALGTVVNMERKVTEALEAPHRAAGEPVRQAAAKKLDETTWKIHGAKAWL